MVTQEAKFNKLVDYVMENGVNLDSLSKKDIIELYRQLIGEYYDTINKEDNQNNQDT